ncbi:acyclic terpene utilization AtuA family protein [Pseudonocardia nantongensis]|uniref:acyclic terpene utilization AtuA family protein n=1 Tax=Pseudonocardia nantongensis TaxID=1181885 RepID=UPI00397937AD
MATRSLRIGNVSGYLGDRYTAVDEAMAGDPVDVLMGDYLAEITLAALAASARRGKPGHVAYALDQLTPHLPEIARRGIRVVTNAGGLDPAGMADELRRRIADAGVHLRVAHVAGDGVFERLADFHADGHGMEHLDTGAPLKDWGVEPIAANAYLGGFGIATALAAGADIVVTGRVTDASLTAGPAAWWHGWTPDDHDALAGAVTAGHVIECGAHATGGNFSGFRDVPGMLRPGFPIAEIAADGSSVITKHAADGGTVTVDTVTAQLLYEIQGPRYLNPDATVHLDSVQLSQEGPDRVAIGPVTGSPPPPTAKVAVFAPIGYEISTMLFCTAPDVAGKVELLRAQLRTQLEGHVDQLDVTPLGVAAEDPATQWAATVPIRVIATARDAEPLRRFAPAVGSLYLQGFPGFHHDGHAPRAAEPWPRIEYWPALLDSALLEHHAVLDDGTRVEAPRSARTATPDELAQPVHPEPDLPVPDGEPVELGTLTFARAGDKGGNANVGVWAPGPEHWDWLRATLTTARAKELLPEAGGAIVRHEFPHLRAVHLVLTGLLGSGGSANLRVDQIGKSVGEYLRAKHVPGPR